MTFVVTRLTHNRSGLEKQRKLKPGEPAYRAKLFIVHSALIALWQSLILFWASLHFVYLILLIGLACSVRVKI